MRKLLLMLICLMAPTVAFAQAGPGDDKFKEIVRDRSSYDIVVFFFGDSIMRGFALGDFPDTAPAAIVEGPLWPLRSPAAMAEFMTSNPRITYAYGGGPVGPQQENADDLADRISDLNDRGILTSRDIVVLEDAGDHGNNHKQYEKQWRTVIDAAEETGAMVLVLNVFDGGPDIEFDGLDWRDFSFSTPLLGEDGYLRTYNDAISSAVASVESSRVILLDLDTAMRSFERMMLRRFSTPVTFEGVHPNVWGQCKLVSAVLRASNVTDSFGGGSLKHLLSENVQAVTYHGRLRREDVETAVDICTNSAVVTFAASE